MRLMHPEAVQRSKPLPPYSSSSSSSFSSSSSSSSSSSVLENEKGEDKDEQEDDVQVDREYQDDTAIHPCSNEDKRRHQSPTPNKEHSLIEDSGITRPVPQGPGPRDLVLEELVSVTSAKVILC